MPVSKQIKIILASASPRRRVLLEAACFEVEVRPPDVDETWPGGDVEAAAMLLAQRKLDDVGPQTLPTVAADTIVVLNDTPLGKPVDRANAIEMLQRLSGCEHRVITGFCVDHRGERRTGAATTRVQFRPLTTDQIERYVDTGEALDKAGAYGIQGLGGALVDQIHGSYTNVVGLPLPQVIEAIEDIR